MEISENIKEASYGKHILSYVIDAAIVIVAGGIIFGTLTSTYMMDAIGGNTAAADCLNFQGASGLYAMSVDGNGNYTGAASYDFTSDTPSSSSSVSAKVSSSPLLEAFPKGKVFSEDTVTQTRPAYAEYMDMLWTYYTDFLPRGLASSPKYDSRIAVVKDTDGTPFTTIDQYYAHFEIDILGLPKTSLYDDSPSYDESSSTLFNDAPFYRYSLTSDKSKIDITAKPVLQKNIQDVLDTDGTEAQTKLGDLKNYFYTEATDSASASGLYVDAMADLEGTSSSSSQTYYYQREVDWSLLLYACIWTAFLPLQLVFFLVIPLLMPNGETLGKKIFGLGVIGVNDTKMKMWQKILRPLLVSILGLLIIVPFLGILAPMIYIVLALVDYMMVMLSKNHQSLHDKFTKTIVVNVKESTWFASEEEKADFATSHPTGEQTNESVATEAAVLDLSTIAKDREEAKGITNFDDYEKSKDAETETPAPMVNLTKEEEPASPSDKKTDASGEESSPATKDGK